MEPCNIGLRSQRVFGAPHRVKFKLIWTLETMALAGQLVGRSDGPQMIIKPVTGLS